MATCQDVPPLNPFAFPSETKGRFTLLILAALALALNLGFVLLSLTGSGQREMQESLSILEEERARGWDGAMAGFKVFDKSGPELQEMSDRWTLFFRQQLAKRVTKLLIPVG